MGNAVWPLGLVMAGLHADTQPALAQTVFANGFEESCTVDSDGDRLVNCLEAALGTSLTDIDTDNDGLRDGDEALGTLDGLDLPAMGADPMHKDLLLEHDWANDSSGCSGHSHKPTVAALEALRLEFAEAPIQNPDGVPGINVISDYGQGGNLTGGALVEIPNAEITGQVAESNYMLHRAQNFAANRIGFFHYILHVHRYTFSPYSSGQAEIYGDDVIVSMGCAMPENNGFFAQSTIMHELGHNLGLHHGGGDGCNYKPNYNSIMRYEKQRYGRDLNCDNINDFDMGYSTGTNAPLDENALNEAAGICDLVPINWNGGSISASVSQNINLYSGEVAECGGEKTILTDWDDWAHVTLQVLPNGANSGEVIQPGIATCASVLQGETP